VPLTIARASAIEDWGVGLYWRKDLVCRWARSPAAIRVCTCIFQVPETALQARVPTARRRGRDRQSATASIQSHFGGEKIGFVVADVARSSSWSTPWRRVSPSDRRLCRLKISLHFRVDCLTAWPCPQVWLCRSCSSAKADESFGGSNDQSTKQNIPYTFRTDLNLAASGQPDYLILTLLEVESIKNW